jgi:hypothetical protein
MNSYNSSAAYSSQTRSKTPFLLTLVSTIISLIALFTIGLFIYSTQSVIVFVPAVLALSALVVNILAIKRQRRLAKSALIITIPIFLLLLGFSIFFGMIFVAITPGTVTNSAGHYSVEVPVGYFGRMQTTAPGSMLLSTAPVSSLPSESPNGDASSVQQTSLPTLVLIPVGDQGATKSDTFARQVHDKTAQLAASKGNKVLYQNATTKAGLLLNAYQNGNGIAGSLDDTVNHYTYFFGISVPSGSDPAELSKLWEIVNTIQYYQ